jgi:hypothetical protein
MAAQSFSTSTMVWNQIWFLAGDAGEGLANFSLWRMARIASAVSNNPDSVEVYDIRGGAVSSQLRRLAKLSPVVRTGDTVTLSADRTRDGGELRTFFDPVLVPTLVALRSLTGPAPLGLRLGLLMSAGGDFFRWSYGVLNDKSYCHSANHDGGGVQSGIKESESL